VKQEGVVQSNGCKRNEHYREDCSTYLGGEYACPAPDTGSKTEETSNPPAQPQQNSGGGGATKNLGESCTIVNDNNGNCGTDLTCSGGQCKVNNGSYHGSNKCCALNTQCASDELCNGSDGDCHAGTYCKKRTLNRSLGQNCADDYDSCASGLTCQDVKGTALCRYTRGSGSPVCCEGDSDCPAGPPRQYCDTANDSPDRTCSTRYTCATRTDTGGGDTGDDGDDEDTGNNNTIFNIELSLPGIKNTSGNNQSPTHPQRNVTIKVLGSNDQLVSEKSANITYSSSTGTYKGNVNMGTLATGIYTIKLEANNSLRKIPQGSISITNGTTNQIPKTNLVTGDLNKDNSLNVNDYNTFISCFGDKQCSQKQLADLNDDGKVDLADYNILMGNFATQRGD